MSDPVFKLREAFQPDSYWPDEYAQAALPLLSEWGWLSRPATAADESVAVTTLSGLNDIGLDVTDVYPFGLLWALRSTGAIGDVAGLDWQLIEWRRWEEGDHIGEPLDFLPPLPTATEEPRTDA